MAELIRNYSPNFSLPKRPKKKIKFIIIHYTGMKRESAAIKRLCNLQSKVSSHYFIKKNGKILILVPPAYEAWHAGKSSWKKFKSLNKYSIGIEIQNSGHQNSYENYSSMQIKSLIKLLRYLKKIYGISPKNVLGHSDIAPERKKDPGGKFPWKKLAKFNLSYWHKLRLKRIINYRLVRLTKKEQTEFFKNIFKLGYLKIDLLNDRSKKKLWIKVFQRRFRQELINGILDQECLKISKSLIKY